MRVPLGELFCCETPNIQFRTGSGLDPLRVRIAIVTLYRDGRVGKSYSKGTRDNFAPTLDVWVPLEELFCCEIPYVQFRTGFGLDPLPIRIAIVKLYRDGRVGKIYSKGTHGNLAPTLDGWVPLGELFCCEIPYVQFRRDPAWVPFGCGLRL